VRYVNQLRAHLRDQPIELDSLPTHNATNSTVTESATMRTEPTGLLYLLHCNSTSTYGVKLHQDLIHEDMSDQDLFRYLRTIYCRARGKTKWFTLRNTTNISLCKVHCYPSHHY
jgi:hypothetical protein